MAEIDTYKGGYFHSRPWLRAAFESVPREHFTPDRVWVPDRDQQRLFPVLDRTVDPQQWLEAVYSPETALITQIEDGKVRPENGPASSGEFTSSISCPAVVVNMLHHLNPQPGEKILEIGTGSGYNTALLAWRVGAANVVSIEIDPDIAQSARANLEALASPVPTLAVGDGEHGYPHRAPFDRVISTACVRKIPPTWVQQVRPGGVILTPVTTPFGSDAIAVLTRHEGGTARGPLVAAVDFMLVRGQRSRSPWSTLGWPRLPDFELTAAPDGQTIRQYTTAASHNENRCHDERNRLMGDHSKPQPAEEPKGPPDNTDGQSTTVGGGDSGTHRKDK
ncbi:methyltransferase domain-containing protein [Streptomyces sp. TLI_146]|uniref:methyltransferase domain-containing protein n=1 Tax=Streptomyces sp. TLI_146 TaxID=1938858 RepID=UPI00214B71D6|nr:methyltransferase domain-containing protein [Streptomyces sp. TLI_146]